MLTTNFDPSFIEILNLRAYYDEGSFTRTRETNNMLQYESQHFKCKVQLKFKDSQAQENWSVGLIQACDYMYLENRYGTSGSSFWEFHPLKSNRHFMVNDSDGRQYPFYSRNSSKCEVRKGQLSETVIKLEYDDHFYPTVAWELPQCHSERLTDVIRRQDFWVWLVAIRRGNLSQNVLNRMENGLNNFTPVYYDQFNERADTVYILRTMRWCYNLHMTFDPTQPIGRRLVSINDRQKEQPYICPVNQGLPLSALCAPHCNAGQSLIWYPAAESSFECERPRLLVPPYQIITSWNQWCSDMVSQGAPRNLDGTSSSACGVNHNSMMFASQKPKDCQVVANFQEDRFVGQEFNGPKPSKLVGKLSGNYHKSSSISERSKRKRVHSKI